MQDIGWKAHKAKKQAEAKVRDEIHLNKLSEKYNIDREYLDQALYDNEKETYDWFEENAPDFGHANTGLKEPTLGSPQFRHKLNPDARGFDKVNPYGKVMGWRYFRASDEERSWLKDEAPEEWVDEKEVMDKVKHDYKIYRARRNPTSVFDTAEDKIMNGFIQQDNKYKMGK